MLLRQFQYRLWILLALTFYLAACATVTPRSATNNFADAHVHYNWDQKEIVSAEEIIKILKKHNVGRVIVSGTPTPLALELRQAGDSWVVPFFSPYTHELGKQDWYKNSDLGRLFRNGLEQKLYFGLGEVHFMAGFPPTLQNPVFLDLLSVAAEFDVPTLIHIDSANAQMYIQICQKHSEQKLIFAHAGGNLKAAEIAKVIQQCANTWIDLAARDPWRYGALVDTFGKLLPDWKQLILKHPQRFITGTDPVWRVTRTQSWDQADDGWSHYDKLYQFHLTWINELPENIAEQIRWTNVHRLLDKK